MGKFKVGDIVIMQRRYNGEGGMGVEVAIVELRDDGKVKYIETDGTWGWRDNDRELPSFLKTEMYWSVYAEDEDQLFKLKESNKAKTFMANIVDKVRNLALSAESKLLRKHGIENPEGAPTDDGIRLMQEILYRENREKVIAEVKKIEEAEQAEKKA